VTAFGDNERIFARKQKYENELELPSIAEGPDDYDIGDEESEY